MLESSKRVISHRLTDIYNIVKCAIPTINIPILSVTNINVVTRAIFMAYYYSIFCLSTGDTNPNKVTLEAAMLGLLFNVVDPTRILEGNAELYGHCSNGKAGRTAICVPSALRCRVHNCKANQRPDTSYK
jgi:hypothetical protein